MIFNADEAHNIVKEVGFSWHLYFKEILCCTLHSSESSYLPGQSQINIKLNRISVYIKTEFNLELL